MNQSDSHHIWWDAGWWVQPDGTRRLLSWNAGTHELTLLSLDRRVPDLVLAVIPTEDEVRLRLEGWQEHTDTKEGMAWLADRLEGCR